MNGSFNCVGDYKSFEERCALYIVSFVRVSFAESTLHCKIVGQAKDDTPAVLVVRRNLARQNQIKGP
jgi:hypothetical protein